MVLSRALFLALAIAPFGAAAAPDSWTVTIDGHPSARGCVASDGDDRWERICLIYYCSTPALGGGYFGTLEVNYYTADEPEWFEAIDELRLFILIDGTSFGEVSLTRVWDDWEQYQFTEKWDHDPLVTALRAGHDLTLRALPVPGRPMPPDMHISLAGSNHALGTMLSHCPPG